MSVEYWLVDAESGNAQGCYLSLEDALQAAEFEVDSQPVQTLCLLGMRSPERAPQSKRIPEADQPKQAEQRLFVRFDLGLTREAQQISVPQPDGK